MTAITGSSQRESRKRLNSPTQQIASYVEKEKYEHLPSDVVKKTKRCILDSIGCQLGGYTSNPGRCMADLFIGLGGRGDATVIGSSRKIALQSAALVNTYMANILDFDDTFRGHPGCTVIPPALAGAEMVRASGKELITAVTVGYEIHAHVFQAMYSSPEKFEKVSGVASQTFGSVASISKILSLSYESVLNALGIAGSTAPVQSNAKTGGSEEVPPTMKVGFYSCSQTAVISALLAKSGITGPHTILDGDTGFWQMIGADECRFELLTQGLGSEYETMHIAFKPYSCCRWFHSSIDALLSIIKENKFRPQEISAIQITTKGGKTNLEYMKNPRPENFVAAEFSLPYSASVAAFGIEPGPDWISEKSMSDKSIQGLASRIHCEFELKNAKSAKASDVNTWPAYVGVQLNNGEVFSRQVDYPKGSPMNMMSDEELDEKFIHLAKPVLGVDKAPMVMDMIKNLEKIDDVNEITDLLGS